MNKATTIAIASAIGLGILLGGCSMFNAAGEITLGNKEKIPRVTQKIDWPDIDDLTGSALNKQVGATGPDGKPLLSGIPKSLKKGTLAHVQGLLSLAGDCQREIKGGIKAPDPNDPVAVKKAASSPIKDITITITNCSGDARCKHICGDFEGVQLSAEVELELLTEAKAKELRRSWPRPIRRTRPMASFNCACSSSSWTSIKRRRSTPRRVRSSPTTWTALTCCSTTLGVTSPTKMVLRPWC